MGKQITIEPITRLEGHGMIDIFLNDEGNVDSAFLRIPELRGFEKFCEGRLAEEVARITPKICGVCPTTHHMAAGKTLDALYHVGDDPRTDGQVLDRESTADAPDAAGPTHVLLEDVSLHELPAYMEDRAWD